ncbi:MAG: enoyl-CoA hydratase [Alphaproteobacteria bacterium]|nr:enoyl-CoA hydratase [Alphaproteobacteria bacterium]
MTTPRGPSPHRDVPTGTPRMLAHIEGAIGWIVFNNPERHNALSRDMWEAIPRLVATLSAESEVRLLVLKGAGDKAFISGADISEFETERATPEAVTRYDAIVEQASHALGTSPRPTIAMIRGHCMGGGLAIALSCDLRLASEDSGFAIPAAKLGVGYRASGLKALVDLVGPAFAKEIIFTARHFSAEDARVMGLVNRAVPAGALEDLVRDYARIIGENAPLTIQATKQIIHELLRSEGPDVVRCDALIERCFESADYIEGRRAFMEKRRPKFSGK